jgi:hypothetical protein
MNSQLPKSGQYSNKNLPATEAIILDFTKPLRIHNCPRTDGISKKTCPLQQQLPSTSQSCNEFTIVSEWKPRTNPFWRLPRRILEAPFGSLRGTSSNSWLSQESLKHVFFCVFGFLMIFLCFLGSIWAFTRLSIRSRAKPCVFTHSWCAVAQNLVKTDMEPKNAKHIKKIPKNKKTERQCFRELLGELGPPPHPGVSESLSVFVFCCFFCFLDLFCIF